MKSTVLLTTAYLAPVQYYTKLLLYPRVAVEQHDHYLKQTYRNRCIILGANGPQSLTIPVSVSHTEHTPMHQVRISEHGRWRHLHWEALVSAYERSPYFEFYAESFQPFYEPGRYEFLQDFNEAMQDMVCGLLDLHPATTRTMVYCKEPAPCVEDLREDIHPKRPWSGDPLFRSEPYYQVFGGESSFFPNLSIADLLFNMGPEGILTLQRSIAGPGNP